MVTGAVQTTRARIDAIAAGGDGVARSEGLVIFAPRTAPGDVADVDFRIEGRLGRASAVRVVEPSPDRVAPPCPHYTKDRCGGCQLQHLRYDAQLAAKQGIVGDALRRIGKRDVTVDAVRRSPSEWRYRSKLTLAMRQRDGAWTMGLHAYDDPDVVFDLEDCPITDRAVVDAWRAIRAAGDALPDAPRLRGAVRLLDDGVSFVLEGGNTWPQLDDFVTRVRAVHAIWWEPDGGRLALVYDRRTDARPAASFAQVNREAAAGMQAYVLDRVLSHRPRRVVDAYAGAGATALPLAEQGIGVTAIERDREAVAWMRATLPAGSRAVAARVEDALGRALPADVVIVNPPRGGVDVRVTRTLDAARPAPRAIVYVSCNPATLARDLGRLPHWRVASVAAFDLFPQTAHVETVCELVPEAA